MVDYKKKYKFGLGVEGLHSPFSLYLCKGSSKMRMPQIFPFGEP